MLSPSSSPPSPLNEVPISSPEPHKNGNAPPLKASQPSSPPIADVEAPPPTDSSGGKAPSGEPVVWVPTAPGILRY